MKIVVPEIKRLANLAKHGLDLNDFEDGFSWDRFVALEAKRSVTGRTRFRFIGTLNDTLVVAAVVSPLGTEALSIISLRPASILERATYDERT